MSTNLRKCGDHQYAPGCLVCVHLVEGHSTHWCPVPIEEGSELESDWLCPECLEQFPDIDIKLLQPICMHCVRELQLGGTIVA